MGGGTDGEVFGEGWSVLDNAQPKLRNALGVFWENALCAR